MRHQVVLHDIGGGFGQIAFAFGLVEGVARTTVGVVVLCWGCVVGMGVRLGVVVAGLGGVRVGGHV